MLIPHTTIGPHGLILKTPVVQEGVAAYQVVGVVTAHQADDG